jgi:chromosome segregation ATPase
MQMDRLIALSLAAGMACGTLALSVRLAAAQSAEEVDLSKLATLQADLQTAAAEETAIAAAIGKAVEDSKLLIEQHKSNIERTKVLEPEGEALRAALSAESSEAEKQQAAAAQHNAACPRETKDAALVAKCNGEIEPLNAWAGRIKAEIDRLEPAKAKYNEELEGIQKRDQQIIAQLNALRAADSAARTQLEVVRGKVEQLRTALAAGKQRCSELEQAAADAANAEVLRYCRTMILGNAATAQMPPANPPQAESPK